MLLNKQKVQEVNDVNQMDELPKFTIRSYVLHTSVVFIVNHICQ